jgi:retron-type reverse transcriptase
MIRHSNYTSESWSKLPWKKFRRDLFRLQKRVFKAVREGNKRKALSLQKLILKSTAARLLAIRQVSQQTSPSTGLKVSIDITIGDSKFLKKPQRKTLLNHQFGTPMMW